jgi:hypothetical protein
MSVLEQLRLGKLKVKGRNLIRLVKLEDYYRESRHEARLIKALAESIVLGEFSKGLDLIYRCIEKPKRYLCLYELEVPAISFKHLIILDYSILIEAPNFLVTHCKLRDDLLIEVEMYSLGRGALC